MTEIQFIQALLEANGLAAGKDHQFKGRYEAEKNAVIISLENDERECSSRHDAKKEQYGQIYVEKFTSASLICKVFYGKMKAQ